MAATGGPADAAGDQRRPVSRAGVALDLVGGWHLLDTGPREILREDLGCDDQEWMRGQAWAFAQAMGLVWYYVTSNPTMSVIGRRTLDRLVRVL